jgi:hypothetical protein
MPRYAVFHHFCQRPAGWVVVAPDGCVTLEAAGVRGTARGQCIGGRDRLGRKILGGG